MITPDSPWRTIGDTTWGAFVDELGRVDSPMLEFAEPIYRAAQGVTRLFLAHSQAENIHDTVGILIRPDMHNPLALRARYGEPTRNNFAVYENYADCVAAWRRRFDDPNLPYRTTATLRDYCRVYNPTGDIHPVTGLPNNPDRYCNELLATINRLPPLEETPPMVVIGNRPLRIAIGAGHRNTSGGNEFETDLNGRVTNELVKLEAASTGFDLRCFTPGDGLGWFNGPLDAAARQVVAWANAGWVPDIFCEIHHQGLSNTSTRGGFIIHPDGRGLSSPYPNSQEVDEDARDFGGTMARILCSGIGVPVWGDGVMSERETGVGGQGYRLGVFGSTDVPVLRENCTRFVTEAATYTNAADKALMVAPGFAAKEARALLEMFAALGADRLGWEGDYRIGGGGPSPAYAAAGPFPPFDGTDRKVVEDGSTFYAAQRRYKVVTRTTPRRAANPKEAATAADMMPGASVEGLYVVTGTDGQPWVVSKWGSRIPMAALTPKVSVTP